jgi:sulfate adenylyltransferase
MNLPNPHGGKLVTRTEKGERIRQILQESSEFEAISIPSGLAQDIENIAYGVFSPLQGFLVEEDYLSVLSEKRLANDVPWTIPLIIDVSREEMKGLKEGDLVLLHHGQESVSLLHIESIYTYKKKELACRVFGTTDQRHPGVSKIYTMKEYLLGGNIDLLTPLEVPPRFRPYALNPSETRHIFKQMNWKTVAAFQTRNIPHTGHEYMHEKALTCADGLFIHPLVGEKKQGDFTNEVVLRAYEALIESSYLKGRAVMGVLQTEMRYAGPREAIFHAIIRKNFGCTHFIVGRDHAGIGNCYDPYAAQHIFEEFPDLGITPLFFKSLFYCKKCGGVKTEDTCHHDENEHLEVSGSKMREMLSQGKIPSRILLRPEVARAVLECHDLFVDKSEQDLNRKNS